MRLQIDEYLADPAVDANQLILFNF